MCILQIAIIIPVSVELMVSSVTPKVDYETGISRIFSLNVRLSAASVGYYDTLTLQCRVNARLSRNSR